MMQDVDVTGGQLRYARNGDVRLAYRVFGDSGPFLVWVAGAGGPGGVGVTGPRSRVHRVFESRCLRAGFRLRAG